MTDIESLSPTTILAYVDEEGAYDHVRDAALKLATRHGARLIYYDASSASAFSEPVVSDWSAAGEERKFGNPLTDGELEALGRRPLATRVRAARERGIDAWGWLPSERGVRALMDYAGEQSADLVLVPDDLKEPGFVDRIRGQTLEPAAEDPTPVGVVDKEGRVELV